MFEKVEKAPADPILGLNEAFKKDPNPEKINLGVGVFQDESGTTPTMRSVAEAEKRLADKGGSKTYLPIQGSPVYGQRVRELLFGESAARVNDGTAVTAQTPGGTGALRMAGELMKSTFGIDKLWLSDPTWANHNGVFTAAGMELASYPYYDPAQQGVGFDAMAEALRKVPAGEAVLLHACCHNPTGFDLDAEQWAEVKKIAAERGWLPVFDFAYQGFGDGLDEDAAAVRSFAEDAELLVCSSFSKNFGLYNERAGALTVVARKAEDADSTLSQLKRAIRANYSNPPRHASAVVETVLEDADLRADWKRELDAMRARIKHLRSRFVEGLKAAGVTRDLSFLLRQRGMFSYSGLTPEQVDKLREEHSIYMVRSGRINVAGMREANMDTLCKAVAAVL